MGTWQVADAHQEFADDLAAGEHKLLLEQLHPLRLRARVMRLDPLRETSMRLADRLDALRVLDHRAHLQLVAHDARILQQPCFIARAEARDLVDIESLERLDEG